MNKSIMLSMSLYRSKINTHTHTHTHTQLSVSDDKWSQFVMSSIQARWSCLGRIGMHIA